MPLRPGYGTQGTAVLLWANYMAINRNDKTMNVVFYRYKIDIHPDKDGKVPKGRKAAQIIRLALEQEYGAFVAQIATDYK
jgi:eukaryotic translation initiation factor 2C